MDKLEKAIEHTKNKKGMKLCITGLIKKIVISRDKIGNSEKYSLKVFGKHYNLARKAWLNGDLKTVAEFFGLYTGDNT